MTQESTSPQSLREFAQQYTNTTEESIAPTPDVDPTATEAYDVLSEALPMPITALQETTVEDKSAHERPLGTRRVSALDRSNVSPRVVSLIEGQAPVKRSARRNVLVPIIVAGAAASIGALALANLSSSDNTRLFAAAPKPKAQQKQPIHTATIETSKATPLVKTDAIFEHSSHYKTHPISGSFTHKGKKVDVKARVTVIETGTAGAVATPIANSGGNPVQVTEPKGGYNANHTATRQTKVLSAKPTRAQPTSSSATKAMHQPKSSNTTTTAEPGPNFAPSPNKLYSTHDVGGVNQIVSLPIATTSIYIPKSSNGGAPVESHQTGSPSGGSSIASAHHSHKKRHASHSTDGGAGLK